MTRVRSYLLTGLLLLGAPVVGAPASAAPREHETHGTVRRLCSPAVICHWVSGPAAGRLRRGTDVRRFDLGPRYALGVTSGQRPALRGFVLRSAFCPPSARGRRAQERARALAARTHGSRTPGDPARDRLSGTR